MRQLRLVLILAAIGLFQSCFESDTMVQPHEQGELTVGVAEMGENYQHQVFFDLGTNTPVSRNLISDWDLGFETSDSGWHIVLNSSRMMTAGNTFNTDFSAVANARNVEMKFDPSDRFLDSTAIGDWYELTENGPVSLGNTYIIDRGSDLNGFPLSRLKAVFDVREDGSYLIRWATLTGENEKTDVIAKDTTKNFVCYSFETGVEDIEPRKPEWDLVFTKYSTMLSDAGTPYPYVVTGVLLNPYSSFATVDSTRSYDEITRETAVSLPMQQQKDIIGYDWKTYNFNSGRYMVDPDKVYILKDNQGFFYKLRFIGFYNSTDTKGFPTFEYVRL